METGTSEFSRTPKPGLLRSVPAAGQAGRGTQAPGEGFALTIAERECAKLNFEHEHDRRDVILGVGLVAAKRASLIGRGPQLGDVKVAMDLFGLRGAPSIDHQLSAPFRVWPTVTSSNVSSSTRSTAPRWSRPKSQPCSKPQCTKE